MLWWIILFTILENEKGNWDRLRSKETELPNLVQQEYSEYFNKLFANGIPNYTLKSNTTLFRARHIKSGDIPKPGVNISDVMDSYYRIILTNEEINKIENINNIGESTYNLQLFSMLKAMGVDRLSEEQQKKINELFKENSIKKIYGFPENESRVPPPLFRKAGRFNTASDAYLYVAFDKDMAIHEMRPSIGQKYSIVEFRSNKETKIADLTGSNMPLEKDNILFLSLVDKISEPNTDDTEIFYHITQHMAHILQEKGYDGIMYKSTLKKEKNNILLFDEVNVGFVSSEIVVINNVNIDYSNILPLPSKADE